MCIRDRPTQLGWNEVFQLREHQQRVSSALGPRKPASGSSRQVASSLGLSRKRTRYTGAEKRVQIKVKMEMEKSMEGTSNAPGSENLTAQLSAETSFRNLRPRLTIQRPVTQQMNMPTAASVSDRFFLKASKLFFFARKRLPRSSEVSQTTRTSYSRARPSCIRSIRGSRRKSTSNSSSRSA